jgi:hypothetical protein
MQSPDDAGHQVQAFFTLQIVYIPRRSLLGRSAMRKPWNIVVGLAVTLVLCYMLFRYFPQIQKNVSGRDSIAYWSSARLLVHRQNPYNHVDVLRLEQEQGYPHDRPLILRTPPWSLFMVVYLGLLDAVGAWVVWISISLVSLIFAVRMCRRLYGDGVPPNVFSLVAYTLAPVPACLVSGQLGIVLTLGLVLFLYLEAKHPFLAGAALIIPFAKPHLLSLFWVVLALWVITRKKHAIALGFVAAFTLAVCVALVFDARVFIDYREMLKMASIQNEFIPALSGVLRLLFLRRFFWAQFVPLGAALIWALWYFFRRRYDWDWRQHGPALVVVSLLTTPYAWLADETVVLPAVLQATAFAYHSRKVLKLRTNIALGTFAFLNFLLVLILKSKVPFATGIYFWSSLVWFAFYFTVAPFKQKSKAAQSYNEPPSDGTSVHA